MQPTTRCGKRQTGTGYDYDQQYHVRQLESRVLLDRCMAGDKGAWDKLIKQNEKSVYRCAYKLCGNYDDAADIAGHVFVRVYQGLPTFRNEASFSSWVFRIVRNTYLDLCVRPAWRHNELQQPEFQADQETISPKEYVDPAPLPDEICIENEVSGLLKHAVIHLPPYQRQVLQMYHQEGKTYEEIAAATGISIGTVKSRLNRARRMLCERLAPHRDAISSV